MGVGGGGGGGVVTESVTLLSLTVHSPAVWVACGPNVTNNLQYTLLI